MSKAEDLHTLQTPTRVSCVTQSSISESAVTVWPESEKIFLNFLWGFIYRKNVREKFINIDTGAGEEACVKIDSRKHLFDRKRKCKMINKQRDTTSTHGQDQEHIRQDENWKLKTENFTSKTFSGSFCDFRASVASVAVLLSSDVDNDSKFSYFSFFFLMGKTKMKSWMATECLYWR